MKSQLVYDIPLRLFHWIFAALFVFAFAVAKTVDDEALIFSYHMMAGLLLSFIVLLRLIWGFVGTRHARFSSLLLRPSDLLAYLKGVVFGDQRKWAGHNPASSWSAIAMLAMAAGLGVTGFLMARGQKEAFEDFHELLANGFLVMVFFHIAGLALHALRHRDGLILSMATGTKKGPSHSEAIASSRPLTGLLFLVLIVAFSRYLAVNFNTQTRSLNLFGTPLQLGESQSTDDSSE